MGSEMCIRDRNLIDYNFKVYGDKSTRAGLLSKWDNDVSVIPR